MPPIAIFNLLAIGRGSVHISNSDVIGDLEIEIWRACSFTCLPFRFLVLFVDNCCSDRRHRALLPFATISMSSAFDRLFGSHLAFVIGRLFAGISMVSRYFAFSLCIDSRGLSRRSRRLLLLAALE